jgi:hypothetical protein
MFIFYKSIAIQIKIYTFAAELINLLIYKKNEFI